MAATVLKVEKGSIAQECGIERGDSILKINGERFNDILEYRFLCCEPYLEIEVQKRDKSCEYLEIENPDYEDLGIEFEKQLIDDMKHCQNKCIFCFIDQLPKGMRKTLYFKDDDARMSFLLGNYVTLTNMKDRDIDKIIQMRVSPINISVHSTDEQLRIKMLHNKNAGKLNTIMKRLARAGITMNCQIVACPGINDGNALIHTANDLKNLYPYVQSISVVPVGITKFRQGLYPITPYTKELSEEMVELVTRLQNNFLSEIGRRLIYLADEFYLSAGMEIPPAYTYEEFPQIENGVGLIASMEEEFSIGLKDITKEKVSKPKSIATGKISYPFICSLIERLKNKISALDISVYPIENEFFGPLITVSGLICGQDLIRQLKNKPLGSTLLLPEVMLKEDEDIFLDDVTLQDVERELKIQVIKVSNNGYDFINKVLE